MNRSKDKAILWDNDGVLVDTERLFFEANRDIFADHGLELIRRAFSRPSASLARFRASLALGATLEASCVTAR